MPPGRPRNPERNRAGDVRFRARYQAARGLDGVTGREASAAASCVERFRALIIAKGRDPAEFGDLATRLPGGWPRTDPERGRRYRALRARGLSSLEASCGAKTRATYARTLRRLALGLSPLPYE